MSSQPEQSNGIRVYVDELPPSGWGKWNGGAHMMANDLTALHEMAARIGLRRQWFQSRSTFPHYDLTASKRALAVRNGAVEIEAGELPDDVMMLDRREGGWKPRHVIMARREQERRS